MLLMFNNSVKGNVFIHQLHIIYDKLHRNYNKRNISKKTSQGSENSHILLKIYLKHNERIKENSLCL